MAKGIDNTFVNYGIRKEDMAIIERLAEEAELDMDWIKEDILKEYHTKRVSSTEVSEQVVEGVIRNAIKKIK
ncbi:MAG: hypothetical protein IKP81_01545 [Paludibacteraceae bacterium]|nr:hypothetical protein [Paludibacteraceae bacterium]MBR6103725.1 hypothetical protein [Paludibacteraceae bacterium]